MNTTHQWIPKQKRSYPLHCHWHSLQKVCKRLHLTSSLTDPGAKVFDDGGQIKSKDTWGLYNNQSKGMAMTQASVFGQLSQLCCSSDYTCTAASQTTIRCCQGVRTLWLVSMGPWSPHPASYHLICGDLMVPSQWDPTRQQSIIEDGMDLRHSSWTLMMGERNK